MSEEWNAQQVEVLGHGRFLRLVRRGGWEFVERLNLTGIVVVAAVSRRRNLVLVSQWREPVQARVVELPAGLAGDHEGQEDESLAAAAARELWEETGFHADRLVPVWAGPPSAGVSGEVMSIFLAEGVQRVGPGGGEEGEGVRTHVVPLSRLDEWCCVVKKLGWVVDPKVLAGVYFVCRGGKGGI
jgi:ADP-ribose pyrophosphatase